MNLRNTTLLTIGITTLGLIGVLLITVQLVVLPYFEQEQIQSIEHNLQHVQGILDGELTKLEGTGTEWGITGILPELNTGMMESLSINLVQWVPDAGIRQSWYLSPEGMGLQSMPASLEDSLSSIVDAGSGLVNDGRDSYLVGVVPFTPAGTHVKGWLLLGRVLDSTLLDGISNQVQLPVDMVNVADPSTLPPEFQVAYNDLSQGKRYTTSPLDSQVSAGYLLLRDVRGNPAVVVQIQQARTVFRTGVRLMTFLIIALTMSGITFSTILYLVLETKVLSRLRSMNREMKQIGQSGDITLRVKVQQHDELTELASTINSMLNDLQHAQHQRMLSEEQFRSLVESMDDVVFTIDRSQGGLEVFGRKTRDADLNEALTIDRLNKALMDDQFQLVERVLSGERLTYAWVLSDDGGTRHYYTSLAPIHDPAGDITGVVGVVREITTLKNLETSLRQRVDALAALYEVSQILLSQARSADLLSKICSLAVERFALGGAWLAREESDGGGLEVISSCQCADTPAKDLMRFQAGNEHPAVQAHRSGKLVVVHSVSTRADRVGDSTAYLPLVYTDQPLGVLALYHPDQEYFNEEHLQLLQAFASLVSAAVQNAILFEQVMDGQQRLQALSRKLVNVQEQERRQIALELHDEIGQILTGLRILLELDPATLSVDVSRRVVEAQGLVKELIDRVRQISLNLRPSILDDLGLLPTLYWHFNRYTTQTGIQVIFNHSGVEGRRFSGELETAAYRMVQEALTNVARYAEVNEVHVHLWCNETTLGVQVEDNGRGFHLEDAMNGNTRGISGLRERLMLLGGRLEVETQPGSGTCLTAEIPLVGLEDRKDSGGKT